MKDRLLIYLWWGITLVCFRLTTNKRLFVHIFDRMILTKGDQDD